MGDTTQYTIGAEVRCQDQACGQLARVVIDPVAGKLTHLVVEPGHGEGVKRLVPIDSVDAASGDVDDIHLRCTAAEFTALTPAEETEFLSGGANELGYQPGHTVLWPYYGLGVGGAGMGTMGLGGPVAVAPLGGEPRTTTYDRLPKGEVEIRRGDGVESKDGEIGRVKGLVIDPQDHAVTHVLLEEGHLWGRKTVAIPIRTVTYAGGTVQVDLSKKELEDLPQVDLDERN